MAAAPWNLSDECGSWSSRCCRRRSGASAIRGRQRAVERGNVLQANALAQQLTDDVGEFSVSDSLALLLLFAEHDAERFRRAAPRWHARFVLAARDLSIEEAQAALAALALLRGPQRQIAFEFLGKICREHGARFRINP